ncbi:MAG: DUF1778 domain-containing protein [Gammaproteobacteria bacterium]
MPAAKPKPNSTVKKGAVKRSTKSTASGETSIKTHSASGKSSSKGTHGARKKTRSEPINIRVLSQQKDLIDKAASVVNKTRSDFMIEASCREAENVLLDRRLFVVDNESFEQLEKILSAPLTDNEAILSLMEYKAPWEG